MVLSISNEKVKGQLKSSTMVWDLNMTGVISQIRNGDQTVFNY